MFHLGTTKWESEFPPQLKQYLQLCFSFRQQTLKVQLCWEQELPKQSACFQAVCSQGCSPCQAPAGQQQLQGSITTTAPTSKDVGTANSLGQPGESPQLSLLSLSQRSGVNSTACPEARPLLPSHLTCWPSTYHSWGLFQEEGSLA